MKLGYYLYAVILLGIFFDYVEVKEKQWFPPDGVGTFFIYRDYEMHFSSVIYYTQESITYIALACLIFFKRNQFFWLFIVIEAIDLVDLWFTGNTAWFYYFSLPVTFNIIKVFTFTLLLANESIKHITSQSRDTTDAA
jgi:hypothetical protein